MTFLLPFPNVEKQINFALLDRNLLPESAPADLPDFLFDSQAELKLKQPQKLWLNEQGAVNVTINLPVLNHDQTKHSSGKYILYYEMRMNLNSVELHSGDTIYAPIRPGVRSQFHWIFTPVRSGNFAGNIWVYVHVTDAMASSHWQSTRFVLPLRIQVVDFLGLSLRNLRALLLMGLFLSAFLLIGINLIGMIPSKPG